MIGTDGARKAWARIAGVLYIGLIACFIGADHVLRGLAGKGSYSDVAARLATNMLLYRSALAVNVMGAVFTVMLAVALYAALKTASPGLARLALFFRLAEATLGGVMAACGFAIAHAYASPFAGFGPDQMQGLISLVWAGQGALFSITTLFFGMGSILFFCAFWTSRAIPRALSAFGFLASLAVPVLALAGLIVPETAKLFQPGWFPIMIAELATGAWLVVFAVRVTASEGE